MVNDHTTMLLDVAARVAERLRTDPQVNNLLDPAIFIAAFPDGCDATLLERLEVMHIMGEIKCDPPERVESPSVGSPAIAVLIADKSGGTFFTLPDPRSYPTAWPWAQGENAQFAPMNGEAAS